VRPAATVDANRASTKRFVVSATILSVQGALNYGPGRGIFPDYVRVINAIAWIVDEYFVRAHPPDVREGGSEDVDDPDTGR